MSHRRRSSEREQLEIFRALPGDLRPRDAQDLMAYPFFSLAKSHRTVPIDFRTGEIAIRVEAVPEHGMATIWDADVLIWAASQIVEARDAGLRTSRLMAATPYEILTFVGRGTSVRDYHRLKAALDRLQSTTVATSLRQATERRMHRFSWINEWTERADGSGHPDGIDLIVPDWFYRAVLCGLMVNAMAKLKLGPLADDKPVRLVVDLPAQVHPDLVAYAEMLGREMGSDAPVEAAKLVAPMLAKFMATDRGFATARRVQPERPALPRQPASSGGHATGSGNA